MRKVGNNNKKMMELKMLQEQLNCQINKKLEWKIKLLRQKEFEGANKLSKLLAWQFKKWRGKVYSQIKRKRLILDQNEILKSIQ